MKNKIRLFTALILAFSVLFITCKKDKDEFSADDAKVEIRSASQQIQGNMGEMMATPGMQSLFYLMTLLEIDDDWKSSLNSAAQDIETYNLSSLNNLLRENLHLKTDDIDPEEGGEYTYNFVTEIFELTNPDVDFLRFIFPADDIAYANQQLNGELTLDNIVIVEIEFEDEWGTYYEEVLTSLDASLKIGMNTAMTCSYRSTLNNEGLPTSVTFNMGMTPYQYTLTQTGSGSNYTSTASIKHGNDVLMSYNLNIRYTAQQDDIDKLSGNFQVTPLRFEGEINALAMDNCGETDISCMNRNIDVEVIQTEKNKIIGHIEFRMFTDTYWNEEYAEPVIVYSDGTWEWLYIALGLEFDDLKRGLMKK